MHRLNLYRDQRIKKNSFWKILVRLLLLFLILGGAIFLPVKGVMSSIEETQSHAGAIASAYQIQNFGQIETQVAAARDSLKKADLFLNFLFWVRFVPVVGGYYTDSKNLVSAAVEELTAIDTLLVNLKPDEKELGFVGAPLAGQDRVSQALKILEKSLPHLKTIEKNLKKASDLVEDIDVNKYPNDLRGLKLKDSINLIRDFMVGAEVAVSEDSLILKLTPSMLGVNQPKTYLLLFQNDKEIRATGGFITAYAFLKIDRGQVTATTSDDIYRLDERLLAVCQSKICPLTPPPPIVKYLPEVTGKPRTAWSMRDSNISPNIPTSARQFERMYQLLGSGVPFDGIIYIDSQVVEKLIEVTGPIEVFGTPYSSKLDKRCNCPNVIYELESYAEIAAKGMQDRKAILGVLMQQILARSVGSDIEQIPRLIQTVVNLANHKHILFFMHETQAQQALSALNWIGQIKDYQGDYLHINDSNFAGGKSNLYVDQTVTQEISVEKDGTVRKKIIIEYKNPQSFNTWLNGINRDYVRFYVPLGSKLISSNGSDEPVTTASDLDKTVFEAFVTVRPQNSRKLQIEYTVPYKAKGEYKLLVQKQPGAKDFHYKIKINGSQKADFKLDQDKEFKFNL